ncbi:MAG TPA: hypothetical protein VGM92_00355, partial [Candidatus Kapabacteria bacterium]
MKRSHFGVLLLLLIGSPASAQWLDSSDSHARTIFDIPGSTTSDPDETLEYLDALSSITGNTLERLHAKPDVSWLEAHRAIAHHAIGSTFSADSSAKFLLRSRGASAIDPEAQAGYSSGAYLGSPQTLYNRISARSSAIEVSMLEQKQAWEPSFTDRLSGFWELKNSVSIAGPVSLEKAVIGNYALAFGNGLLFGSGLASSTALNGASGIEERSFGLRGTVTNSVRDLFGGATEWGLGPANFFLFGSDRARDATVTNDTIRTISTSNSHSTEAQIELENAAHAETLGARAELKTADTAALFLKSGLTAFDLRYDHPYVGTINQPFLGRELQMAGADLLAIGRTWSGIAEVAVSSNDTVKETAVLVSASFEPADHTAFSILYRHIPYRFVSPFAEMSGNGANSFSDFEGYYFGVETSPIPDRLRMSAYSEIDNEIIPLGDLFGKERHDYLFKTSFKATQSLELSATVRDQENANVVSDSSQTGYVTLEGQTLNTRLEATYRGTNATSRSRYDHVFYAL